jgi:NitT/TauT family transport system permease protein
MKFKDVAGPLTVFLLLLLWQALAWLQWTNSALFPSPLQILAVIHEIRTDYETAFLQTAKNVFLSFLLSGFLGVLLAIILSTRQVLRDSFLPIAMFFQTVPIIAIAPLLVIYFGYGAQTIIAAATIVSIFPVIANSLIALTSTPQEELELFAVYKASQWQSLLRLRLPRAYLGIYSGLRIAGGLAVIGVVAGEFVAGGGLGALIDSARTQQRIDIVYACLLGLSALGLGLIGLLTWIHNRVQNWRPLALDLKQ